MKRTLEDVSAMQSRSAEILKLAREHAHERDALIVFDEPTHTYTIDGVKAKLSVTGLIAKVESSHFDADAVATKLSTSARPSAKYSRVDESGARVPLAKAEILKMWDDARDFGTDLHGKIERYLNDIHDVVPAPGELNHSEFGQFLRWWKKQLAAGFEAYRTEWVIFTKSEMEKQYLAGSIDFVMRNTATGELSIVDWKRCLTSGSGFDSAWGGKRMLPPMDHFEETKLNHWLIQVNVYRLMLEKNYGVRIADMRMVVLYDDQDEAVEFMHARDDSVEALIRLACP